jgi:hypothetical protein
MISLALNARELFGVTKRLEYEAQSNGNKHELEAVCFILDCCHIKPMEAY